MTDGEYMGMVEAARYLGVSRTKMAELVRKGILPHSRSVLDRRAKLIRRADLDALKSEPAAERQAS